MQIENYCQSAPGDKQLATFDVYIPEWQLTFRKFRLIKAKNGNEFVGVPSYCIEDPEGNKNWIHYFQFSEERGKEFMKGILEELKNFV